VTSFDISMLNDIVLYGTVSQEHMATTHHTRAAIPA